MKTEASKNLIMINLRKEEREDEVTFNKRKILYSSLILLLIFDVITTFIGIKYVGLTEMNFIYDLFTNFWFTLVALHIIAILLVMMAYEISKHKQESNKSVMIVASIYLVVVTWNLMMIIVKTAMG